MELPNGENQDGKNTGNEKFKNCLQENILVFFVLLGAGIGFGIGFGVRPLESTSDAVMWLGLPGDIFMRMLKMTIVPLIIASLIAGTASLDPRANGKMGIMSVGFVILSNFFGAFLAVAMFFIFRPDASFQWSVAIVDKNP
ncbi:hypothetical protein KUTeg_022851 [Tegillarca granosa]|uniref:Amino acid transporter n=1 Tax=Tegillarca granosa TaxID=220873 RepID=A0ABQ9DZZ1_TEGGR|nr:hypothetical protein KUTeg_022851 [Tegillarca granosa]